MKAKLAFVVALSVALPLLLAAARPAQGAFPGLNGRIVVQVTAAGGAGDAQLLPDGLAPAGDPRCCFQPAWSPDGRDLAVVAGETIAIVGADGRNARRLAPPGPGTYSAVRRYGIEWERDASRLAFTEVRTYPQRPGLERWCCRWSVLSAARDGTDLRVEHPTGRHASWSPGGRSLAVELEGDCCHHPDGIAVVDRSTGEERRLLGPFFGAPRWSPAGNALAVARGHSSSLTLHLVRPDGTGRRRVPGGAWNEASFAWSPDGRRLAYAWDASGQRLAVASASGTTIRRIPAGRVATSAFSWSPDGRTLAIQDRPRSACLKLVAVATGRVRTLACPASRRYEQAAPSWAPDSRRVALAARGGILIVDVATGRTRLLPVPPPD